MPVAPGKQAKQHRTEIPAALGQHILVARRPFAVAASFEQAGLNHRLEPPGQDVGRDAQAVAELLEPGVAAERVAQDEDAPPFADVLKAAGDRARHGAE